MSEQVGGTEMLKLAVPVIPDGVGSIWLIPFTRGIVKVGGVSDVGGVSAVSGDSEM